MKAARALLGWSQTDLAGASGISEPTIKRLEASGDSELGGRTTTIDAIRGALEEAGVEFTNGGEPGVKLRRPTDLPDYKIDMLRRLFDREHIADAAAQFDLVAEMVGDELKVRRRDKFVGTIRVELGRAVWDPRLDPPPAAPDGRPTPGDLNAWFAQLAGAIAAKGRSK